MRPSSTPVWWPGWANASPTTSTPTALFSDDDRARRRGLRLGAQGPDGMSRLSGWLDPEARAYFEAIEAAVRPGRHQPETAGPEARDERTPAQRCHDALKLGLHDRHRLR